MVWKYTKCYIGTLRLENTIVEITLQGLFLNIFGIKKTLHGGILLHINPVFDLCRKVELLKQLAPCFS